jgi:predicted ATPase
MPATPFIGRVDELATLAGLVRHSDTRLVTILAPGGMGKTRLAIAAAERLVAEDVFADGVAFVDLTPLASPANLDAAAAALGLPLDPNPQRTPRAQLLDYLREKRLLLVLDNCEHLCAAVEAPCTSSVTMCGGIRFAPPCPRKSLPPPKNAGGS